MIIRQRANRAGSMSWQLDYGAVNGKRVMRSFPTEKAAQEAMAAELRARKRHGEMAVVASSAEMAEFLLAKERLEGVPVLTAVDFYLQHAARLKTRVRVPVAVEEYLLAMEDRGMKGRSLETMRSTLRGFARWLPLHFVHDVTAGNVLAWLRGQGWAAGTQRHRLNELRTFLAWCREGTQGFLMLDPTAGVAAPKVDDDEDDDDDGEVETLTLAECKALLTQALEEPVWMGYVALGLFTGMRRCELQRTRWERVRLEEEIVIVGRKQSKGKQARRVIGLEPAAVAWIEAALKDEKARERVERNRFIAPDLKKLWPAFRARAGLKSWPNNAMRHTFASMDYAHWEDIARLQARMGHTSAKMIHEHYRALKTRREAAAFWALRPPVGLRGASR